MTRLDRWSLIGLPQLNVSILDGDLPVAVLVETLARHVLADLPTPESFAVAQARQLLVHLAFCGSSVARHYQEAAVAHRATPERAFDRLRVGTERIPFRTYFARLAERTGSGHCDRDCYATLIRWNVPTTEVRWDGSLLSVLPGAFDDGQVRTYTNDSGERLFFLLAKRSEALERAANALLEPISAGRVAAGSAEAISRVRVATTMLTAIRQINTDFAALPVTVGLSPGHFMDVFRQYAVHWRPGDIPPSGAHDPEALKRDLLFGLPDREQHVRRQFPALLAAERAELTALLGRPSLPELLLALLRPDEPALPEMSADELRRTVRRQPALAAWYLLLTAHARAAGMHLMLAKKYLFRPGKARELAGIPDSGVVPRDRGTTGMDESFLDRLTRQRHGHALISLHQIPHLELLALAGIDEPAVVAGAALAGLVSVAGPSGPAHPVVPAGPAHPVAPAGPAHPVAPAGPAHPVGPGGPAGRSTAATSAPAGAPAMPADAPPPAATPVAPAARAAAPGAPAVAPGRPRRPAATLPALWPRRIRPARPAPAG